MSTRAGDGAPRGHPGRGPGGRDGGGPRPRPLAATRVLPPSTSCATRCAGWKKRWTSRSSTRTLRRQFGLRRDARGAVPRAGTLADIDRFAPGEPLCVQVQAPPTPEGALFAEDAPWRFALAPAQAASATGAGEGGAGTARAARAQAHGAGVAGAARAGEVLVGTARAPRRSSPRAASVRWWPTTRKRCGPSAERLLHDTLLGAYLLEPARRGYPFTELCEERGLAGRRRGSARQRGRAARRARGVAARGRLLSGGSSS